MGDPQEYGDRTAKAIGRFTLRMEAATAVLAVTVLAFVYVQVARPFSFRPLRNPSPQTVTSPIVKAGGDLLVTAVKCNDSTEAVPVQGSVYLVRQDPPPRMVIPYSEGGAIRYPGCLEYRYQNTIPEGLPAGMWVLEGIEVARSGEDMQQIGWYTAPFEVVDDD